MKPLKTCSKCGNTPPQSPSKVLCKKCQNEITKAMVKILKEMENRKRNTLEKKDERT